MEKIISKISAVVIPCIALNLSCKASEHKGGAAITTALSSLGGSGGMKGGLAVLSAVGVLSGIATEYVVDKIFIRTVRQLCIEGESQEKIFAKIERYPVSKELKLRLKETVRQYNELSEYNNH